MEMVVVVAVTALLLAALILALISARRKANLLFCVGRLECVGTAFRIWAGDHHDQYPMAVSVTNGGAMELLARGNVAACFQVMSNELSSPGIVLCPGDTRQRAASFGGLGGSNVSYFIDLDATEAVPQAVLSGDANLVVNGRALASGILCLGTNTAAWAKDRHFGEGNVLLCDGSVMCVWQMGSTNAGGRYAPTNRVVIP